MIYDVLIVGGGIVGCAIARELTRYRLRVALCEREVEVGFGTTKANSGIIHGGHHAAPDTLKGRLEWEGNQLWDALAQALHFGFRRVGELTVAHARRRSFPHSTSCCTTLPIKGVPGVEHWTPARIQQAEPALSPAIIPASTLPPPASSTPMKRATRWPKAPCATGWSC
jgi:glycerol-3-phosphate dehydrogenase